MLEGLYRIVKAISFEADKLNFLPELERLPLNRLAKYRWKALEKQSLPVPAGVAWRRCRE